MTERERLIKLLSRYFQIGDSYAYNLTRVKTAFEVGTMSLEDFEEFDENTVADIADHLIDHGIIVPPCKVKNTVWCVLEDERAKGGWFIGKEHVTDVSARGIWLSAFAPPKDDHGNFIPWEQVGVVTFTTREEAEAALAERRKI